MIQILINNTDYTSQIAKNSLEVDQILGVQRDTARFVYKKYGARNYVPAVLDTVIVYDGNTKIFGGRIAQVTETFLNDADGLVYLIECVDFTIDLDSILVSQTYTNQGVNTIISDILATNAPGFTANNVATNFVIPKVVFNQVPVSQCIKRLADTIKYDWYVDPDKDVHFFAKYAKSAPYNLTDISGNYIVNTLERKVDGSQIANQVKVRGGEYQAATYSDSITVKGNATKSLNLPYKFVNLTVSKNGTPQTIGIDYIDDFSAKQVLYNYNDKTIKFQNNLADGDVIAYSGNPKVRVLAIASDATSIGLYGVREKLIEDTTIVDLNTARQRAIAELASYKDQQVEGKFETYTAGLRTGMVINLNSSRRNSNVDFLIRTVKFRARLPDAYFYSVELVTTKSFDLVDVLQNLLQPEALDSSDAETTEIIKTDVTNVTVVESIARQTPGGQDVAIITILENVAKDPLGDGVEPEWVLGPYVPTSISDPKREGLLDYSLEVY